MRDKNRNKFKLAKKFLEDKNWMYDQYITLNLSLNDIANTLNIDSRSIKKFLIIHQIFKEKSSINEARINKIKQSNMAKYGVISTLQLKEVKQKSKETMIHKYGVEHALNNKMLKNKQENTLMSNYGVMVPAKSDIVKEKIKETNNIKYGGNAPINSIEIKEKIENTNISKYGYKNCSQNELIKEKVKETNNIRYGGNAPLCSPKVKEKIKNTFIEKYGVDNPLKNNEVREKMAKTNLEKYGVDNYTQTEGYKLKCYNTKKLNNSFHISKPEQELKQFIKSIYPNTISQYKSELYPFTCDFYIPERGLYVEFQGNWTHGTGPYNGDNLNPEWIKKAKEGSKFYKNAIEVFTVKDPLKRKTAVENNLNFLEIWYKDYKKGLDWIESLIII